MTKSIEDVLAKSKEIENALKLARQLREAHEWYSLYGSRYSGGGGGVGHFHCNVHIYHQAYNGAKNYHPVADGLRQSVHEKLRDVLPGIVEQALKELGEKAEAAMAGVEKNDGKTVPISRT